MAEVTPGHWLFALLGGQEGILFYQLRTDGGVSETLPDILAERTPLVLPEKAWPMLVTFDDPGDPKTVRLVDPLDLAATFGPGVALKSVTVEVTDEPMTEGRVEGVLGWLGFVYCSTRFA